MIVCRNVRLHSIPVRCHSSPYQRSGIDTAQPGMGKHKLKKSLEKSKNFLVLKQQIFLPVLRHCWCRTQELTSWRGEWTIQYWGSIRRCSSHTEKRDHIIKYFLLVTITIEQNPPNYHNDWLSYKLWLPSITITIITTDQPQAQGRAKCSLKRFCKANRLLPPASKKLYTWQ